MSILTQSDLHALMPRADSAKWIEPLGAAMARFALATPARMAMFLAQVAHESAGLTRMEENLNYSRERLHEVWPSRFTPQRAAIYERQPEKIANLVYANRLGNGSQSSGDGWKYRGRGPIQLTGRDAYRMAAHALALPLEERPEDVARDPMVGALVAAWVFAGWKGCIRHADRRDLSNCTLAINGGLTGLASRADYYRAARRIFEV